MIKSAKRIAIWAISFLSVTGLSLSQEFYMNQYGSIQHPEIDVIIDSTGIQVSDFKFDRFGNHKPDPWSAKWIWLNKTDFPNNQKTSTHWLKPPELKPGNSENKYNVALIRKIFSLQEEPEKALVYASADVRYRLFLNGHLVGRGPADIGGDYDDNRYPQHWFYDAYDMTTRFKKGTNVIAVEVYTENLVLSEVTMGHGGFLFEANIQCKDGKEITIQSDSTWRGHTSEAFSKKDNTFIFDARHEPSGWMKTDFDDRAWPLVDELGTADESSWWLWPSEIPSLMETQLFPQPITRTNVSVDVNKLVDKKSAVLFEKTSEPVRVTLDFGKEITGYVGFKLKGQAGTSIKIQQREKVGHAVSRKCEYTLRTGAQEYEFPFLGGFRYLDVTIDTLSSPLEIMEIWTTYSSFPVEYKGSFSCSDPFLNKLWNIIRWTTQLCMQTHHLDSPIHQEPIACTGDYMIESLINYYTFGSPWLARQDLTKTAYLLKKHDFDMFHTSYSLLWVEMLSDYYMYTGDVTLVKELLPTVNNLMDLFETYLGVTGLITEAPDYMFLDWTNIGGFNAHHPPCVIGQGYMTAFYYNALLKAVSFNNLVKNTERASYFKDLAAMLKYSFNKELFDKEKGLYKDGTPFITKVRSNKWNPADIDTVTYSPHINTLTVLYDLAPQDRQNKIMTYVLDQKDILIQPYFMHFVLSALAHTGQFNDVGLQEIKRWNKLIEKNTTSLKEMWQDEASHGYQGDYSHAWGGTPCIQLAAQVLGIKPTEPGFKTVEIKPTFCDLDWAKGKVPTPHDGEIEVEWRKSKYGFNINVFIPQNIKSKLYLPITNSHDATVKINDEILFKNSRFFEKNEISNGTLIENFITFDIVSGHYNFIVKE